MNRLSRLSLMISLCLLLPACAARQTGKAVAKGAAQSLQEPEAGPASRNVSSELADGLLQELSKPKQRERLAKIAGSAAAGALAGASGAQARAVGGSGGGGGGAPARAVAGPPGAAPAERMARQLGEGFADAFAQRLQAQLGDGRGPLAQELSATAQVISGAMVRGAATSAFPECQGPDRDRCIAARLGPVQQATGASLGKGMLSALGPLPAIALAVMALTLVALLAWAIWLSLTVRALRRSAVRA